MANDQRVLSNSVKLLGEVFVTPGTSLLLAGYVDSGLLHGVLGIAATALLGPVGQIGALLIAANSYSKSITNHNLWESGEAEATRREQERQAAEAARREQERQAAVLWNNGKVYFFRGREYIRYDVAADRAGTARQIADNWPGVWPEGIDAAVLWNNGNAYFFRGREYIRYDVAADRADPARQIAGNWPGVWPEGIDAAVLWNNGKAFFFRGREYIRYDVAANRADPGYPIQIAGNWPGLVEAGWGR